MISRRHELKAAFATALHDADMNRMLDWFAQEREHGEPLHFAREVMKLVNTFCRREDYQTATCLCVSWLADAGVVTELDARGSFSHADNALERIYSYTFEFGFIKKLAEILIASGRSSEAVTMIDRLLAAPDIYLDTRLALQKCSDCAQGITRSPRYDTLCVDLSVTGYDPRHYASIEEFALGYLEGTSAAQGVVLDTDRWSMVLSRHVETLVASRPKLGQFLRVKKAVFDRIRAANRVTCGRVGLPDLLVFDPDNFTNYSLVEVKSPHDRLSEMQEAWIDFFADNDIRFYVLKFTGRYRKPVA